MGRRGVLDQVGDQLQHLFVIPHIPEWVIAEGRIRVEQIEHPYFISRSFEKAASLAQNFSFGIINSMSASELTTIPLLSYSNYYPLLTNFLKLVLQLT